MAFQPHARYRVAIVAYVLLAGTVTLALAVLDRTVGTPTGLTEVVREGPGFEGRVLHRRTAAVPDLAVLEAEPTLPRRFFTVTWDGVWHVRRSGRYDIHLGGDDRAQLFLDGRLVLERGPVAGYGTTSVPVTLAAGFHELRIRYEQEGGGYFLTAQVASAEGEPRPFGPGALFPTAPDAAAVAINDTLRVARRVMRVLWLGTALVLLLGSSALGIRAAGARWRRGDPTAAIVRGWSRLWAVPPLDEATPEVPAPPPRAEALAPSDASARRVVAWAGVALAMTVGAVVAGRVPWSSSLVPIVLVLGTTSVHFVLCPYWVLRLRSSPIQSVDELVFQSMVIALGTLQTALHVAAFTVGLSLTTGLLGLMALHATLGLWGLLRAGRRSADSDTGTTAQRLGLIRRQGSVQQVLGAMTVVAITCQWAIDSTRSLVVRGTDAAHYHVPHAVNLALGATPFPLLATGHAYPMGASVLAAWLMQPVQDPLFLELTTLPSYLLVLTSVALLFRLVTGEPGLGWTLWPLLVLFTGPVFRTSLSMSADLFYAAGFLALLTQLFARWIRPGWQVRDMIVTALALGMLLSSKSVGALSAVVLLGLYLVAVTTRAIRLRHPWSLGRPMRLCGAGLILAVLSGGVWLVRNLVLFGSPTFPAGLSVFGIEVFSGNTYRDTMYYLSVLGDLQRDPDYAVLGAFTGYTRELVGAWLLPLGGVAILFGLDVANQLRRGSLDESTRRKSALLLVSVGLIASHTVVLVGAPWTSLEWTGGTALRYLLPLFVLYVVALFSCLFPTRPAWHRRPLVRAVLWLALVVLASLVHRSHGSTVPSPAIVGLALGLVALVAATGGGVRGLRRSAPLAVGLVLLIGAFAVHARGGAHEPDGTGDHSVRGRTRRGPGRPAGDRRS